MIKFEKVTKIYSSGLKAVNNVSFLINKGEMVFIAGHSGAGKSTILKLISGISLPTYGKIFINNQNISKLNYNQLCFLRQHIGIVFQDHKILYDIDVLSNVLLPLKIMNFNKKDAIRRAFLALEKVGLYGKENKDPITLSGGEQQRLCIARAIVHKPGILIADEPSANLDRNYALDIMELFATFHKNGTTVIIAAHDESIMADYGHKILRFNEGKFAS